MEDKDNEGRTVWDLAESMGNSELCYEMKDWVKEKKTQIKPVLYGRQRQRGTNCLGLGRKYGKQ